MLAYLRQRAQEEGVKVETVEGDMNKFKLRRKCDFAFVLSGSLYVDSNKQFLKHLDCVANALKRGGLYLFENFPLGLYESHKEEWVITKGQIEVKTTFETRVKDELKQTYEDKITFEVNDHGEKKTFSSTFITKNIAPQELKALIELNGRFEFIGWFEHLKLEPLTTPKRNNIVILRKK
jgi:SAM-dependent methyltransferase